VKTRREPSKQGGRDKGLPRRVRAPRIAPKSLYPQPDLIVSDISADPISVYAFVIGVCTLWWGGTR
jgi:hypothetical protein